MFMYSKQDKDPAPDKSGIPFYKYIPDIIIALALTSCKKVLRSFQKQISWVYGYLLNPKSYI